VYLIFKQYAALANWRLKSSVTCINSLRRRLVMDPTA